MDPGGAPVSKAVCFLGLSVWDLFMTGNCSRTWFVTTSCRYSNFSLTAASSLKIDHLIPRIEKSKEIEVGEGPVCSAASPQTDFEVRGGSCSGLFNHSPKS